jgi:hypothetical protein
MPPGTPAAHVVATGGTTSRDTMSHSVGGAFALQRGGRPSTKSITREEAEMMRTTKTMSAALVVLGAIAGAPRAARALTTHTLTFDGNMCQSTAPDIKRSINGVYNASPTYGIPVFCPIPRDLIAGGPHQQLFAVGAGVYDRNPGQPWDVTCTLKGIWDDTGVIDSLASFKSSGSGTPIMRINTQFGPLITASSLVLECVLPPTSGGNFSHIQMYSLSYYL